MTKTTTAHARKSREVLDLPPGKRRVIFVALLSSVFLASLDVTVVSTAMPTIASELGGVEFYGWIFAAYLLATTVTVPLYGKLADHWGRKPTYFFGITVFLSASVFCAFAPSMTWLIVGRALQGLGAGALGPVTMTLTGDLYRVEERARVQGIIALVWGLSSVVGPLVGALILEVLPWSFIFLLNLPVGLTAALLLAIFYKEHIERESAKLDFAGAALLVTTITAFLLAMQFITQPTLAAALFAGACILAGIFIKRARGIDNSVVPLSLFADRAIAQSAIASVFFGAVLFSFIAYMPLLVRGAFGRPVAHVGFVLIPMSFAWTVGSYVTGKTLVRSGYRRAVRFGALVFAGALAGLWTAIYIENLWFLAAMSFALGLGFGLSLSALNVLVQERVEWGRRGAATSLIQFSRTIGGTLAVAGLGVLLTLLLKDALPSLTADELARAANPEGQMASPAIAAALFSSISSVFTVTCLLGGVGALVLAFFPDVRPAE